MITLQDLYQFMLFEKRRNPDQNPKISAYEYLKKYSKDPDIYVTFSDIKKVGINPKSGFNTPIGIYAYPLKEIWKPIERSKDAKTVPFAGDRPYIFILRSKNKKKFVKDMYKDYNSKDYDDDMDKLRKLYPPPTYTKKDYDIEGIIEQGTRDASHKNPISSMWNVTRLLANQQKGTPLVQWNKILRQLGYTGFADKSGEGIIHFAEPVQAVFLSKDAFKVEDMIFNKKYEEELTKEDMKEIRKLGEKLSYFPGFKELMHLYQHLKKNTPWILKVKFRDAIISSDSGDATTLRWRKGVWLDGTWENGDWHTGTWEKGVWKRGTWDGGTWRNGHWKKGIWFNGLWMNGTWDKGLWSGGTWEGGTWKAGLWEKGTWKNGTWKNGTWKNGRFEGGTFESGKWVDGEWRKGTWKDGTWENGNWSEGTWKGGTWKAGMIWDEKRWVKSTVSPKEYFENKEKNK